MADETPPMRVGFDRREYAWFMDREHQRSGYGDLIWKTDGTRHEGTFEMSEDSTLDLPVEFLITINEMKPDEPHFIVNINNMHAARIDVNGMHRFDGERKARRATHFQCHMNGYDAPENTEEIGIDSYPLLDRGVNLNYETQLQQCFRASVTWLNIDVSGVLWLPMPFEGGK